MFWRKLKETKQTINPNVYDTHLAIKALESFATGKPSKKKIRQNVRIAVKLHKANILSREQLLEIAGNALAWEISISLDKKIERKSRKENL